MAACPKCHGDNPANAQFCRYCGATQQQRAATRACPGCARTVPAAAKFCPSCGANLSAPTEAFAAAPANDAEHAARAPEPPAVTPPAASTEPPGAAPAAAGTEPPDDPAERLRSFVRVNPAASIAIAAIVVLALSAAGYFAYSHWFAASPTVQAANPAPAVPQVTQFATRLTRVRSAPTAATSVVVGNLDRGASIAGTWVTGSDGQTRWLQVVWNGTTAYVWGVNLSDRARPQLTTTVGADRVVLTATELKAEPDANSTTVEIAQAGTIVGVIGVTQDNWAEIGRKSGGVGYMSATELGDGASTGPAAADIALSRVRAYWSRWSSSDPAVMADIENAYGDPVLFYGKSTSRVDVMRQKQIFATRWPQRSYVIREGSLATSCDSSGSTCSVTGLVDWNVYSPARMARSTGTASFSFTLSVVGGQALIVGEAGSVISRQTGQ